MSAPHHQPPHVRLHLARQLAVDRRASRRRRRACAATLGLAAVAAMALVACDVDRPDDDLGEGGAVELDPVGDDSPEFWAIVSFHRAD